MRTPGAKAMDRLFLTVLNMSFTGAFVVTVICIIRLTLKKVPKIISYCLWTVAGIRLMFPFSVESVFGLIPFKARTIPTDIALQPVPRIDSGIPFVNDVVDRVLLMPSANMPGDNPLRIWTYIGSWAWLAGAVVMLVLGVVFYISLRQRMASAIRVEDNIYETDGIQSPFVLGVHKPKIFIPLDLSGQEREYIIQHEQTHIRRRDHIVKFAAYFILCLHWFNPLVWAAFRLMGHDMEMSCDELVLKNLGGEIKRNYSMSLLSIAAAQRVLHNSPLAFGENGVEMRVKNVLKFKKSSRFVVVPVISFVALLSLGLMASRADVGEIMDFNNANTDMMYVITDYYRENGVFSDLGLELDEMNFEKVLVVNRGCVLIAGDRRYKVAAESLTLSFYTQSSLEHVIRWWIDYLDSWAESGKVTLID